MRSTSKQSVTERAESSPQTAPKRHVLSARAQLIPLYDVEQFLFLVERERARADRAAAKPRRANRHKTHNAHPQGLPPESTPAAKLEAKPAPAKAAEKGGQPKPSSDGVWGATTENREFSLAIFRPRAHGDRAGLVELLQSCVRTTDAVGIVDARRLGVLLPDTAADNAGLFVKKVLALATEQGVHLSHVVHTYPAAWPDEDSPKWNEPRRHPGEQVANSAHEAYPDAEPALERAGLLSGLVNWLQSAARKAEPDAARAPG